MIISTFLLYLCLLFSLSESALTEGELIALKALQNAWPDVIYPGFDGIDEIECASWNWREVVGDINNTVYCSSRGHVERIQLRDKPTVTGTIPSEILNLSYLFSLQLHNLPLHGTIPPLHIWIPFNQIIVENTNNCGDLPQWLNLYTKDSYMNVRTGDLPPIGFRCNDPKYPRPQYTARGWFCGVENKSLEGGSCIDLCGDPLDNHLNCGKQETCVNTLGSYDCIGPVYSDDIESKNDNSSSSSKSKDDEDDSSSESEEDDSSSESEEDDSSSESNNVSSDGGSKSEDDSSVSSDPNSDEYQSMIESTDTSSILDSDDNTVDSTNIVDHSTNIIPESGDIVIVTVESNTSVEQIPAEPGTFTEIIKPPSNYPDITFSSGAPSHDTVIISDSPNDPDTSEQENDKTTFNFQRSGEDEAYNSHDIIMDSSSANRIGFF